VQSVPGVAVVLVVPFLFVEIIEGRTRLAFPFRERTEAEAHVQAWTDALWRWRGDPRPDVSRAGERWDAEIDGAELKLFRRPIECWIPLDIDAYDAFYRSFWRRDLWDGQPDGKETGWEAP
jgi:hypothetical protein